MRQLHLASALALVLLASCTHQDSVPTAPVVTATKDIDMSVRELVLVSATATDADGEVVRFEWKIVSAPDMTKASATPTGDKGDVAELRTRNLPGLYLLSVIAVDDEGLQSEPDYVAVNLRPRTDVPDPHLICENGCEQGTSGLEAVESATLGFTVTNAGDGATFAWTAALQRAGGDPLTDEPVITGSSSQVSIAIPKVGRDAALSVSVKVTFATGGEKTLKSDLTVKNTVDEAPLASLEWRQPGAATPGNETTRVLPGDALYVRGNVVDPNGDVFTCDLVAENVVVDAGTELCTWTVYPLAGGPLSLSVWARTASPQASTTSGAMVINVAQLQVAAGPSLTAAALATPRGSETRGRVLAGGPGNYAYVFTEAAAQPQMLTSGALSNVTAVAVASGTTTEKGYLGYATSGNYIPFNFTSGTAESPLVWSAAWTPVPTSTRGMATGSLGKVYVATDQGIGLLGSGAPRRWPTAGGVDVTAIAAAPNPVSSIGEYIVWYASGTELYANAGENTSAWPAARTPLASVVGTAVALAAGPAGAPDLWAGVNGENGNMLILYEDSVNDAGIPQLDGAYHEFVMSGPVRSIAVEKSGPYEGDAWVVAGDGLTRISRAAAISGGARLVRPLELSGWGSAKLKSVAFAGTGPRTLVGGTDGGLLTTP